MVAVLFVFAVWPRGGRAAQDALRVAEAAGKANIAWAITGEGGAVLDCISSSYLPFKCSSQIVLRFDIARMELGEAPVINNRKSRNPYLSVRHHSH